MYIFSFLCEAFLLTYLSRYFFYNNVKAYMRNRQASLILHHYVFHDHPRICVLKSLEILLKLLFPPLDIFLDYVNSRMCLHRYIGGHIVCNIYSRMYRSRANSLFTGLAIERSFRDSFRQVVQSSPRISGFRTPITSSRE